MARAEPSGEIDVEVVYAMPARQTLLHLRVLAGVTVEQAIRQSGALAHHPEIDAANLRVGIFGKVVRPNTLLKAGDRVEIYRPLIVDPKDARRRRARIKKSNKTMS